MPGCGVILSNPTEPVPWSGAVIVSARGWGDLAFPPETLIRLGPSRFRAATGLHAGGTLAVRAVRDGFDRRGCA